MENLKNKTEEELKQMLFDRRIPVDERNAVDREVIRRQDQLRMRSYRESHGYNGSGKPNWKWRGGITGDVEPE